MTSHTPTPWRVYKNPDGTKLVGIGGKDGQGILDSGFGVWAWDDPEGIANAEIVVRAVNSHDDLCRSLKECLGILETLIDPDKDHISSQHIWAQSVEAASKARRILSIAFDDRGSSRD